MEDGLIGSGIVIATNTKEHMRADIYVFLLRSITPSFPVCS
jgi:hypothetical protein